METLLHKQGRLGTQPDRRFMQQERPCSTTEEADDVA